MKTQDKEILLKDLCARLPYGVIVQDRNGVHKLTTGNTEFVDLFNGKCNIKPYLRPMSSMTEEEYECFVDVLKRGMICRKCYDWHEQWIQSTSVEEWLNEHHFDYRGLIPMGLALPATEGMYNF